MNVNPRAISNLSRPSEIESALAAAPAAAPDKARATQGATKVELSERSRQLSEVADVVANSGDIRHDLVEKFRSQIASGSYAVDSQSLATKMVSEP